MTSAKTINLAIENMTCGGCAARVTKALSAVAGAVDVRVNFADETAQFQATDPGTVDDALGVLAHAGYPARAEEARFEVSGLSCGACVVRLQNGISGMPGVATAEVNLADESAKVRFLPGLVSVHDLQAEAKRIGYPIKAIADGVSDRGAEKEAEVEAHRRAMLIAAALTLPVFVLEMGGHLIPALHHFVGRTIGFEASWIIQALLTTAVLFGPGRGFFANGVPALWNRAPNMNSLVALGAGSAWLFSMTALVLPQVLPQGTRAVYFEAAAVIVTLILLGRWFEARAKGRTGAAIRGLIDLQPRVALVDQNGTWVETPMDDLRVGDHFLLRPGARVPTDAEILTGSGRVDESMLTGEPMPISKSPGDHLTGGSVNGAGSLTCAVTRVGQDTTLAQIIRMVQQAQSARLPVQALVDQVTLWFVPIVMLVACVTFGAWMIFGPTPALSYALVAGVSVLIIACPCAMGLATPTSIMVGTGRAAELGILFRQGDALQSLGDVGAIAFDKTGTLTEGAPKVTEFLLLGSDNEEAVLADIAALEVHSEHPIARAVQDAAGEKGLVLADASGVEIHAGSGISGTVKGRRYAIGTADLMRAFDADISDAEKRAETLRRAGQTVFFVQRDGRMVALIGVSDPLRNSSATAVTALKAQGLAVIMISGDAPETAQAVAQELGVDRVFAGVLPDGKVDALKSLQAEYGKVAFVGDGINDAPVLAQSDVGIAIGTGTDVAIETADVVLMSSNVVGVVDAHGLSRLTLRNIKQNLIWAFGYNTLLIPVAAGVFFPSMGILLSPGLAAGAMAFSSVFVLGNALRLRKAGGTA